MRRFATLALVFASLACAPRADDGEPKHANPSDSPTGDTAPGNSPDSHVPLQTTAGGRQHVLRNAALLYRRNHAAWPQRIEDVAPFVHDIDRYESITFTRRPRGELVMRYRLKRQIAGEGGGVVSVFPPEEQ